MMNTLSLAVVALGGAVGGSVNSWPSRGSEPPATVDQVALWAADRDARMAWWREARFGMFVHWGLYSGAGGVWDGKIYTQHYAEWIQHWAGVPCAEYARQMRPLFAPEPGVTDSWASLAKQAGMRYAVMTSKHHDGFTLFNSTAAYSVGNQVAGGTNISPPGRDVAREFAESMRAKGIKPGFYYSLLDWQHPDAYEMALPAYPMPTRRRDPAAYKAYVRAHVHELLTNYGPLATIWFDYSDATRQGEAWGADELMADMRREQPGILVNNRLYNGLENKKGDYGTPEKYVPPTGLPGMDWEVNHTLNESYGFSSHDKGWKDTTTVVRLLCDVVSKGGNLLLNIGPDAKGRVPEAAQETLRGVGRWMDVNSGAIYGTTASPFAFLPWGRATVKGRVVNLMVFDWPSDGVLRVPLKNAVVTARIVGSQVAVGVSGSGGPDGVVLALPKSAVDPACSVIEVEIAGVPEPMPYRTGPGADGSFTLGPRLATLVGPGLCIERRGKGGTRNDPQENLGCWSDLGATVAWDLAVPPAGAGTYEVRAEVACDDASAGAGIRLEASASVCEPTVKGTGGWGEFREEVWGTITLAAGATRITLVATSKPGEAVVNLRGVRLIPRPR